MPTPFDQLMQDLRAAEGDPEKLALLTFDFTVRNDPALKAAAEAAAVPHWFDAAVLAALLPNQATQAPDTLEALKKLPMVETYAMEDRSEAWNFHEATRNALRRRMWTEDLTRFRELSQRAADHFGALAGPLEKTKEGVETQAACRIEAFCHRLLAQPPKGAYDISIFVETLLATHRLERVQAIAVLLVDLVEGPWEGCAEEQRTEDAIEWARAQFNLSLALQKLGICVAPQLGNCLLAQSVRAGRAAMEVYTRESLPQDWAHTQANLAAALKDQGIRSEGAAGFSLLGESVAACRATLEVLTRESLPQEWAMTQNNLGAALRNQGARCEKTAALALLAEAVAAYRAALEVSSRENLPQEWAMTQNNLAIVLQHQGSLSEGPDSLVLVGKAVVAYRAALEVFTRESLPQHWAIAQNNMGNALREQGSRTEGEGGLALLNEAVAAYCAALGVFTRESLPQDWAMTQNNLGYTLQSQGDKAIDMGEKHQFYQQAEAACLLALEVHTLEALPYDHQRTQRNLAEVREKLKALDEGQG